MIDAIALSRSISIHALRVEGDVVVVFNAPCAAEISIHALRVEGDSILARVRHV